MEVIVALVLTGIIASFAGFFMSTFVGGFLMTRTASEGALKAEIALERMRNELKDMRVINAFTADTSIRYAPQIPHGVCAGERILRYENPNIFMECVGGNSYVLLDNIQNFTLRIPGAQGQTLSCHRDLDGVAGDEEVACVDVSFTMTGLPLFNIRIFPRRMVPAPAGL